MKKFVTITMAAIMMLGSASAAGSATCPTSALGSLGKQPIIAGGTLNQDQLQAICGRLGIDAGQACDAGSRPDLSQVQSILNSITKKTGSNVLSQGGGNNCDSTNQKDCVNTCGTDCSNTCNNACDNSCDKVCDNNGTCGQDTVCQKANQTNQTAKNNAVQAAKPVSTGSQNNCPTTPVTKKNTNVQTPAKDTAKNTEKAQTPTKPIATAPVTKAPETKVPTTTTPTTTPVQSVDTSSSAYINEVVRLVNVERAKAGLPAVTVDNKMNAAAAVRATECKTSFSHTRPNGSSCFTALKEAGVSYSGAGENIAYGQRTPADVMNAWMNSEGHRANIMNAKFTRIGVGYTVINGVPYWSQFFAY